MVLNAARDNQPLVYEVEVVHWKRPIIIDVIYLKLEVRRHEFGLNGREVCTYELSLRMLVSELNRPYSCTCPKVKNPSG